MIIVIARYLTKKSFAQILGTVLKEKPFMISFKLIWEGIVYQEMQKL